MHADVSMFKLVINNNFNIHAEYNTNKTINYNGLQEKKDIDAKEILESINGRRIMLVGPERIGKSTTINLIAGREIVKARTQVQTVTTEFTSHLISHDSFTGKGFMLIDAPGVNFKGFKTHKIAIKRYKQAISLYKINYLVFCFQSGYDKRFSLILRSLLKSFQVRSDNHDNVWVSFFMLMMKARADPWIASLRDYTELTGFVFTDDERGSEGKVKVKLMNDGNEKESTTIDRHTKILVVEDGSTTRDEVIKFIIDSVKLEVKNG